MTPKGLQRALGQCFGLFDAGERKFRQTQSPTNSREAPGPALLGPGELRQRVQHLAEVAEVAQVRLREQVRIGEPEGAPARLQEARNVPAADELKPGRRGVGNGVYTEVQKTLGGWALTVH